LLAVLFPWTKFVKVSTVPSHGKGSSDRAFGSLSQSLRNVERTCAGETLAFANARLRTISNVLVTLPGQDMTATLTKIDYIPSNGFPGIADVHWTTFSSHGVVDMRTFASSGEALYAASGKIFTLPATAMNTSGKLVAVLRKWRLEEWPMRDKATYPKDDMHTKESRDAAWIDWILCVRSASLSNESKTLLQDHRAKLAAAATKKRQAEEEALAKAAKDKAAKEEVKAAAAAARSAAEAQLDEKKAAAAAARSAAEAQRAAKRRREEEKKAAAAKEKRDSFLNVEYRPRPVLSSTSRRFTTGTKK
jgi:hypothetical protein